MSCASLFVTSEASTCIVIHQFLQESEFQFLQQITFPTKFYLTILKYSYMHVYLFIFYGIIYNMNVYEG